MYLRRLMRLGGHPEGWRGRALMSNIHAGELVDPVVSSRGRLVGGELWCDGVVDGPHGGSDTGEVEGVVRYPAGDPVEGGFHVSILLEASKGFVGASAVYLRPEGLSMPESVKASRRAQDDWGY